MGAIEIIMLANLVTLVIAWVILYKVNATPRLFYFHSPNWVFVTFGVVSVIPFGFIFNTLIILFFGLKLIPFDSSWFYKVPGRKHD